MKKFFAFAFVALTAASLLTGCGSKKFKTTKNGLKYRFEVMNKDAEMPQEGDVLVGELTLKLDTTTLFSNVGHPDRIFQVTKNMFKGDLQEGLLMLHKGDKAVFGVCADSVANYLQPNQMPSIYKPGEGMIFYYEISLQDIISREDLAQEQANFAKEMEEREANEAGELSAYMAENFPKAKATASGLYIIVNKKGNGPKVAAGKEVSIDYTGRLLDGTIFDSSREADAKASGKYQEGRPYEPMTYVVGQQPLIAGWDEGVMGQCEGTELTIVMPSKLGYGARGAGQDILPYSPLRFDITIVSVK